MLGGGALPLPYAPTTDRIFVGRGAHTPPLCHSEPVTDVTGVGIRPWPPL